MISSFFYVLKLNEHRHLTEVKNREKMKLLKTLDLAFDKKFTSREKMSECFLNRSRVLY